MAERRDGQLRIGVLSPLVAGSYMSAVLSGSREHGGARPAAGWWRSRPSTSSQGGLDTQVPQYTLRAAWDQVAGFVVVVNAVDRTYLEALREAGKPVVLLSEEVEGFSCPVVRADNRSGVLQAVAHLVSTDTAASPSWAASSSPTRASAATPTGRRSSTTGSPPMTASSSRPATTWRAAARRPARAMLAAGMPSTAVFAATDYNALGLMKALGEAGLSCPTTRRSWASTTSRRPRRSAPPSPASVRASGRPASAPPACSSRWWRDARWLPGGIWCPPRSCPASPAAARPAPRWR